MSNVSPVLSRRPRLQLGMGWLPDIPDYRDYTIEHKNIQKMFGKSSSRKKSLPSSVNLQKYCSPIENQGNLGSCTSQAVVGLVEYFEKRAKGEFLDASRRFLYKVTRKLYQLEGDTGAYVRGTMRALQLFGVCPEEFWPYDVTQYDEEPPAFCYAFGQSYQAIKYYRIWDNSPTKLLGQLKESLAKGLPFAFGFTVYSSIWDAAVKESGDIPLPHNGDKVEGGHAIMAVGYDDANRRFLIRNSWGSDWGNKGYGTLPYGYIEKEIADDFWVLATAEYVSLLGI